MPNRAEKPVGSVRQAIGCCGLKEYYGLNVGDKWNIEGFFDALRAHARTNSWKVRFGIMVFVHKRPQPQYRPGGRFANPAMVAFHEEKYFTATGQSKKLNQLQRHIKENNLGVLRIGRAVKNPNSGCDLVPATWEVNAPNLIQYLKATNPLAKSKTEVNFTAPIAVPA